jgi:peptidoglycan hydrolase-like protein with peptidoglycan-binding domain
MQMRVLIGIFLVMSLVGCATTMKGQDIQTQQLQNRISFLEAEVQKKNQEISSLVDMLESQQTKQSSKTGTVKQMSIKQMQMALKSAGFYKGSVDGRMGPQTKQAIKEFQKANGLKADGIIGRQTLEKLSRYLE